MKGYTGQGKTILAAALVTVLWAVQGASADTCNRFVGISEFKAERAMDTHPAEFNQPLYLTGGKDNAGRQVMYGFSTRPPGTTRQAITFTANGIRNGRVGVGIGLTFNGQEVGGLSVGFVQNVIEDQGTALYLKAPDMHIRHRPANPNAIPPQPAAELPLLDWYGANNIPLPYLDYKLSEGMGKAWSLQWGASPGSGTVPTMHTKVVGVISGATQMQADVQYKLYLTCAFTNNKDGKEIPGSMQVIGVLWWGVNYHVFVTSDGWHGKPFAYVVDWDSGVWNDLGRYSSGNPETFGSDIMEQMKNVRTSPPIAFGNRAWCWSYYTGTLQLWMQPSVCIR